MPPATASATFLIGSPTALSAFVPASFAASWSGKEERAEREGRTLAASVEAAGRVTEEEEEGERLEAMR